MPTGEAEFYAGKGPDRRPFDSEAYIGVLYRYGHGQADWQSTMTKVAIEFAERVPEAQRTKVDWIMVPPEGAEKLLPGYGYIGFRVPLN